LGQLGGIVGGVGQSLAITFPITGDYLTVIRAPSQGDLQKYLTWEDDAQSGGKKLAALSEDEREQGTKFQTWIRRQLDELGPRGESLVAQVRAGEKLTDPVTKDDRIWAAIIAVATSIALGWGRYRFIQDFTTVLVVVFTFVTIGNVLALQSTSEWQIT